MEIDEALEVLEEQDRKLIKAERDRALAERQELSHFTASYELQARRVHPAEPPKKGKKHVDPQPLVLPHHLSQQEAKRFIPQGSSIWVATAGAWCGHMPPYRRNFESLAKHGTSEAALRYLLRTLWSQKCKITGEDTSSCPVRGLFSS